MEILEQNNGIMNTSAPEFLPCQVITSARREPIVSREVPKKPRDIWMACFEEVLLGKKQFSSQRSTHCPVETRRALRFPSIPQTPGIWWYLLSSAQACCSFLSYFAYSLSQERLWAGDCRLPNANGGRLFRNCKCHVPESVTFFTEVGWVILHFSPFDEEFWQFSDIAVTWWEVNPTRECRLFFSFQRTRGLTVDVKIARINFALWHKSKNIYRKERLTRYCTIQFCCSKDNVA